MENRLVPITPKTPVEDVSKRLEFRYDYMGRRIRKIVQTWADPDTNGYDWEEDADGDHLFIYDQWNVLLVLDANASNAIIRKYTWGLDLSGQSGNFTASGIHGAGGIAGLLAVEETSGTYAGDSYWYLYDANGNVGQLVENTTGYPIEAKYEYDPYGKIIGPDLDNPPDGWKDDASAYALLNPFRFSTKWLDHELAASGQTGAVGEEGLYYYGYRYYSPELGRWIKRDPIEELGGLHLYAFLSNYPIGRVDPHGLHEDCTWIEVGGALYKHCFDHDHPHPDPTPPPPPPDPTPGCPNWDPECYLDVMPGCPAEDMPTVTPSRGDGTESHIMLSEILGISLYGGEGGYAGLSEACVQLAIAPNGPVEQELGGHKFKFHQNTVVTACAYFGTCKTCSTEKEIMTTVSVKFEPGAWLIGSIYSFYLNWNSTNQVSRIEWQARCGCQCSCRLEANRVITASGHPIYIGE